MLDVRVSDVTCGAVPLEHHWFLSSSLVFRSPVLADVFVVPFALQSLPSLEFEMLYLIGLGLGDAKDITVKGLEVVRRCSRVYLEAYTSVLTVGKDALVRY